jgi:hypothetical protein
MDNNSCSICKRRAYIVCELCDDPIYLCSRGHLHSHKLKYHNGRKSTDTNLNITITNPNKNIIEDKPNQPQIDMRRLFEHIQSLKTNIDIKININNYVEAILDINKCISLGIGFYGEDHQFVNIFNSRILS